MDARLINVVSRTNYRGGESERRDNNVADIPNQRLVKGSKCLEISEVRHVGKYVSKVDRESAFMQEQPVVFIQVIHNAILVMCGEIMCSGPGCTSEVLTPARALMELADFADPRSPKFRSFSNFPK